MLCSGVTSCRRFGSCSHSSLLGRDSSTDASWPEVRFKTERLRMNQTRLSLPQPKTESELKFRTQKSAPECTPKLYFDILMSKESWSEIKGKILITKVNSWWEWRREISCSQKNTRRMWTILIFGKPSTSLFDFQIVRDAFWSARSWGWNAGFVFWALHARRELRKSLN